MPPGNNSAPGSYDGTPSSISQGSNTIIEVSVVVLVVVDQHLVK